MAIEWTGVLGSQATSIRLGICAVVVCICAPISWTAQTPGATTAKAPSFTGDEKGASGHLSFVREFSSAQDVRRAHPVLDRTLDIIAGPKPREERIDALQMPYAVTTDSGHRVFVADIGIGKVHVFDFNHAKYSLLQDEGNRLRRPAGLAADLEDNVYVTDSGSGAIQVYDAKGKFRRYLKESKGSESYFQAPVGIAIDVATEHIYVCDSPRHMIIVLDKRGHILDRFGKRGGGTQPAQFRYPTQIATTDSEILVLDSGNRRIQILDVRGHFRREIKLDYADKRTGLALDYSGNIYVSDAVVNRVQVFSHDGRLLYAYGQMGTKGGEFDGISGLWVDAGHCLYVVDAQNKRIQALQIAGQTRRAVKDGQCDNNHRGQ